MNGVLHHARFLVLGLAALAGAQAGAWRRHALPASGEMVTALAVGPGRIAAGLSSGGVEILSPDFGVRVEVRDPGFGDKGRIHALAFGSDRLWIASEGGLYPCDPASGQVDRSRKGLPAGIRTGVKVLLLQGEALWCASRRLVAVLPAPGGEGYQEWKLPVDDEPTSLLRVGAKILVGTSSAGLLVLDSATGSWIRIGRAEGLSSDQVTGLERVGAEAFVATPEGIDVLDLSTQKVQPLVSRVPAFWMTQANGTLRVSSPDGLLQLDATTRKASSTELPAGVRAEGAVRYGQGVLAVGCGRELLVRDEPTLLGDEPLRLDPDGFRYRLPRKLPQGAALQAFLRLPEWLDSKFPLGVESRADSADLLVRIPSELRGPVQVDLVASAGGRVAEIRSLEGIADRGRPSLEVEPAPPIVRDSAATVSGTASGVEPLRLVLDPGAVPVALGRDGAFRQILSLKPGANRFALRLEDGLGNSTARDLVVSRDEQAPVVPAAHVDTVSGDFARIRVVYRDANPVQATVKAACLVRASVFDSFVILETRKLSVGENAIELQLEDPAGNRSATTVRVVRRAPAATVDDGYHPAEEILASTEPPWSARSQRWDGIGSGLHLLHYRMVEGETLCGVAETFYGNQGLAEILIRWNGFADSSQWRKMPVGTPVDVPFWTDFDFGRLELREALASFPWALLPPNPRNRR